jgi:hypothetical protein
MQTRICPAESYTVAAIRIAVLCFFGTAPTLSRCHDVPMKGNNMTNQNQPGQQNQAPGQQQGGGPKPGQAPGKGDRNPKERLDQTSNTDT